VSPRTATVPANSMQKPQFSALRGLLVTPCLRSMIHKGFISQSWLHSSGGADALDDWWVRVEHHDHRSRRIRIGQTLRRQPFDGPGIGRTITRQLDRKPVGTSFHGATECRLDGHQDQSHSGHE
jgi:hypothetical protein